MLTALGRNVRIYAEDGRRISLPSGHVMLFDDTGRSWPRCGLLLGPVRASSEELAKPSSFGEKWFGSQPQVRGDIDLPPKTLEGWKEVCRVTRIDYYRFGESHGGAYKHTLRQKTLFGKELVVLLRQHGAFRRLDLRGGCMQVSWRGILSP